jgi:hypothetical protein
MKSRPNRVINNQRGSVINVALLILILIFLVGIGLNKISTTDIKIANNMKTQATTFYEAEAGLEGVSELLELNVACPLGFRDTTDTPSLPGGWERIEGNFIVTDLAFWRRDTIGDPRDDRDPETNSNIVAYSVSDYPLALDEPHTSFSIAGQVRYSTGSAIQMAAGYEGLGKGAAAGGASILYDIYAMRYGNDNSEALHVIQWVHLLGLGGTCNYN